MLIRVEGGDGFDSASPSNTRCAALTCSTFLETSAVKAEQNCGLPSGPFCPGGIEEKERTASLT